MFQVNIPTQHGNQKCDKFDTIEAALHDARRWQNLLDLGAGREIAFVTLGTTAHIVGCARRGAWN